MGYDKEWTITTGYITEAMKRFMLRISLCEHTKSKVIWERSGVKDVIMEYQSRGSAGRTAHGSKTTGRLVQLSSGIRVAGNEDSEKISKITGRFNCQVIRANMEKGEIKSKWKLIVSSDVENIRQTGQKRVMNIYIYMNRSLELSVSN